jgi:uncharacterized protein YciW
MVFPWLMAVQLVALLQVQLQVVVVLSAYNDDPVFKSASRNMAPSHL